MDVYLGRGGGGENKNHSSPVHILNRDHLKIDLQPIRKIKLSRRKWMERPLPWAKQDFWDQPARAERVCGARWMARCRSHSLVKSLQAVTWALEKKSRLMKIPLQSLYSSLKSARLTWAFCYSTEPGRAYLNKQLLPISLAFRPKSRICCCFNIYHQHSSHHLTELFPCLWRIKELLCRLWKLPHALIPAPAFFAWTIFQTQTRYWVVLDFSITRVGRPDCHTPLHSDTFWISDSIRKKTLQKNLGDNWYYSQPIPSHIQE